MQIGHWSHKHVLNIPREQQEWDKVKISNLYILSAFTQLAGIARRFLMTHGSDAVQLFKINVQCRHIFVKQSPI